MIRDTSDAHIETANAPKQLAAGLAIGIAGVVFPLALELIWWRLGCPQLGLKFWIIFAIPVAFVAGGIATRRWVVTHRRIRSRLRRLISTLADVTTGLAIVSVPLNLALIFLLAVTCTG